MLNMESPYFALTDPYLTILECKFADMGIFQFIPHLPLCNSYPVKSPSAERGKIKGLRQDMDYKGRYGMKCEISN